MGSVPTTPKETAIMSRPPYAFHFVGKTLRNGKPIPPNGEWLREPLPIRICKNGLHASYHPFEALSYAPGATLCLVELDGIVAEEKDKVVAQGRRIIARFDATELLWAHARKSALSVMNLWDAPVIVKDYLLTGRNKSAAWDAAESAAWNEARRAARRAAWDAAWSAAESAAESAAWSAARSAAESAAWNAARSAAWSAAWSAARTRLWTSVIGEFQNMGVIAK
jgi:hypothetical protein